MYSVSAPQPIVTRGRQAVVQRRAAVARHRATRRAASSPPAAPEAERDFCARLLRRLHETGWCDNTAAAARLATELYKKQKSLGLLRAYSTRSQRQRQRLAEQALEDHEERVLASTLRPIKQREAREEMDVLEHDEAERDTIEFEDQLAAEPMAEKTKTTCAHTRCTRKAAV